MMVATAAMYSSGTASWKRSLMLLTNTVRGVSDAGGCWGDAPAREVTQFVAGQVVTPELV
jgi:hypothetical protein